MSRALSSYMRHFDRLSESQQEKRLQVLQVLGHWMEAKEEERINAICEELLSDIEVNL